MCEIAFSVVVSALDGSSNRCSSLCRPSATHCRDFGNIELRLQPACSSAFYVRILMILSHHVAGVPSSSELIAHDALRGSFSFGGVCPAALVPRNFTQVPDDGTGGVNRGVF